MTSTLSRTRITKPMWSPCGTATTCSKPRARQNARTGAMTSTGTRDPGDRRVDARVVRAEAPQQLRLDHRDASFDRRPRRNALRDVCRVPSPQLEQVDLAIRDFRQRHAEERIRAAGTEADA